jgi:RNA polymerase sigma-70 factor, ECF subfamily
VLDVESFTALLTGCYQRCWLIAMAVTGDRAEADDIVQEASITALRKLADFTPGTNFPAWMSQIVRLTALNHVKKSARRSFVVTDPATIDRSEAAANIRATGPLEPVSADGRLSEHQTDFDDEVLGALREIGDVARACLLLRVVDRLSYGDIAETLQIPEGTAMSHVHRAKQSLRRQLAGGHERSGKSMNHRGPR